MSKIEVLGYVSFVLSVTGVYLNAQKKIWCWPIWIISNIGWIAQSFITKDYPSLFLWICFSFLNGYGWYKWKKDIS